MKKHNMSKLLSLILCAVLIAAMALIATGCSGTQTTQDPWQTKTFKDGDVLGTGSTEFSLTVIDADGAQTSATIRTDKETVGDALLELEIINGPMEAYGMYVKSVNGKTYDYDTDGKYWAFYIDGEYALTGIDQTGIQPGVAYTIQAE